MYNQQTQSIPLPNYGARAGGRGFVNYPYFKNEEPTSINNAGLTQVNEIPAPQYGWTVSDLLNPNLMKKFMLSVIQLNYSVGHLSVPPLVNAIWWEHRKGMMPLAPLFEVHSNVGEGEVVPFTTVPFESIEVSMTKSVLKMAITDEMKMDANDTFISPQDYMQTRMGEAFAYELDKQVLEQLQQSPMKHTVNMSESEADPKTRAPAGNKPIQELVERIFPFIIGSFLRTQHRVTGVAVNPMTWAYLQGVLNREYHGLAMYREGVFPLMQTVDVCPCSLVPQDKMYFVSNETPGIMVITHPDIKAHAFDDVDTASEVQRVDVYRQVFSNILTTEFKELDVAQDSYKANAGVFELTLENLPWTRDMHKLL